MINEKKIDHIKSGKPYSLIDIIAITLSLALCVILVVHSCTSRTEGSTVAIKQYAEGLDFNYDLTVNREIYLECEKGIITVIIKNTSVYVKSSPCKGQDCVHMPAIKYVGQSITCADCRVYIKIEGKGGLIAVV